MDKVRQHILRTAQRLCAEGAEPSMHAVARAAGISRATLYRRFKSAELLWSAVAQLSEAHALVVEPPRQRLLTAARVRFSQDGFYGASVQSIAQLARVGPGTLYAEFGDKRGLLVALVDSLSLSALEEATARVEQERRSWLEGIAASIAEVSHADVTLLGLLLSPDPGVLEARARLLERLALVRHRLALELQQGAVDAGSAAEEVAVQLLALSVAACWSGMSPAQVARAVEAVWWPSCS